MRRELALRSRLLGISVVSIFLTALSLVLFVLAVVDLVLIAVWIGIPLLVKEVAVTRWLTGVHRRYAGGAARRADRVARTCTCPTAACWCGCARS